MSLKEVVPSPSDAAAIARRTSSRSLRSNPAANVSGLAREAIDDLVGLFSSQLELTRAELRQDARAALQSGLQLLVFVPLLIVGYCLLIAAGVYGLSNLWGVWPSLVAAGVLHVAVAAFGLMRASRRLAEVRFLDRSGAELEKSVERVSQAIAPASPTLPGTP
jgi:Flp pilus assembly protein TadB